MKRSTPLKLLEFFRPVNNGAARFSAGIESDFSVESLGLGEGLPEMKEVCKEQISGLKRVPLITIQTSTRNLYGFYSFS